MTPMIHLSLEIKIANYYHMNAFLIILRFWSPKIILLAFLHIKYHILIILVTESIFTFSL